jgi:hypothetical protein
MSWENPSSSAVRVRAAESSAALGAALGRGQRQGQRARPGTAPARHVLPYQGRAALIAAYELARTICSGTSSHARPDPVPGILPLPADPLPA